MATWSKTLDEIVRAELAHRSRDPACSAPLRAATERLAERWSAAYAEFVGATAMPAERQSLPIEEPA